MAGLLFILAAAGASPALAATGTCGAATGQGADGPADYSTYCWLDLSAYTGGTQSFTISLTGGSTLSFTLSITGGAIAAVAVPTWTGAAFGQAAFTGVPGKPALYQTTSGTTTTVTMSNIVLTLGSGGTVPYAIVAADAESTNNGESLSFNAGFSGASTPWTLLATMQNGTSTLYPTLSGVGTTTVTETGVAGTVGSYAFSNTGSPTSITATMVGGGLQGIAFAVKFHAADLTIASSHSGSFVTGTTGSYSLTVTNNGPDSYTTSNTITVTDTLPAGLTYQSASGSGWSCSATGQVVTCSTNANVASGASLPAITVNATVGNTTANSITNSATVSTSPNYDYNSANNTATDVTTVLYATDVQITNTNSNPFTVGTNGVYTLTVTDNGLLAANGTTTVTETLPASETFVSAAGTGWSCSATGQVVTCTSTTAMASGASLPAISLTVLLSTSAPNPVSTTATVSNSLVSDTNSGNNSATDNATVTSPNYINSSKSVVDLTQSPTISGDTLQYTITILDSANQAGYNLSVSDTLDPDLGTPSFVTCPTGASCTYSGGIITVTGINVPANSSVSIVYNATATGSVGDEVQNTATITGGTTSPDTATATPVQLTNPSPTGAKTLYFQTAGIGAASGYFHRVPNAAASTTAENDNIAASGGSVTWNLEYATAKATTIQGNVVANLYIARGSSTNSGGTRSITVTLTAGSNSITGTNTGCTPNSTTTPILCQVTLTNTSLSVPANTVLQMTLTNSTINANRTIAFYPEQATTRVSDLTFTISPAISVDSVAFYSAAYPSNTTSALYPPGTAVYMRAVVSDPFGCFDLNYPGGGTPATASVTFGLTDAGGTSQIATTTSFMPYAVTSCTAPAIGSAYSPSITFEYDDTGAGPYTLSNSAVQGYWTGTVTGREGTEQTVTSTASGTFRVGYLPSLLIVKSVSVLSDPINGSSNPRAIPNATAQYNIVVSNTGKGVAGSMYVTDPLPANVSFVTGSTSFTDGSTSSGLSTPTFSYDNVSCSGSFTYTPSGTDPNVKCVKATFNPAISMNGQTGASAPSFTISFQVKVN